MKPWVLTIQVSSFIPHRVCPRCLGRPITAALLRLQSVVVVVFDLHQFFVGHPHPVVAWVLALLAALVVSSVASFCDSGFALHVFGG